MSDEHLVAERLLGERAERRRIAEQLHDGPVQHVAALSQMLDAALAALEGDDVASGRDGQEILTGREREILQLLADGMSNADVAQRLFISQETVKSHVRHILAKLEAETRTQAVAIALREAMID